MKNKYIRNLEDTKNIILNEVVSNLVNHYSKISKFSDSYESADTTRLKECIIITDDLSKVEEYNNWAKKSKDYLENPPANKEKANALKEGYLYIVFRNTENHDESSKRANLLERKIKDDIACLFSKYGSADINKDGIVDVINGLSLRNLRTSIVAVKDLEHLVKALNYINENIKIACPNVEITNYLVDNNQTLERNEKINTNIGTINNLPQEINPKLKINSPVMPNIIDNTNSVNVLGKTSNELKQETYQKQNSIMINKTADFESSNQVRDLKKDNNNNQTEISQNNINTINTSIVNNKGNKNLENKKFKHKVSKYKFSWDNVISSTIAIGIAEPIKNIVAPEIWQNISYLSSYAANIFEVIANQMPYSVTMQNATKLIRNSLHMIIISAIVKTIYSFFSENDEQEYSKRTANALAEGGKNLAGGILGIAGGSVATAIGTSLFTASFATTFALPIFGAFTAAYAFEKSMNYVANNKSK